MSGVSKFKLFLLSTMLILTRRRLKSFTICFKQKRIETYLCNLTMRVTMMLPLRVNITGLEWPLDHSTTCWRRTAKDTILSSRNSTLGSHKKQLLSLFVIKWPKNSEMVASSWWETILELTFKALTLSNGDPSSLRLEFITAARMIPKTLPRWWWRHLQKQWMWYCR